MESNLKARIRPGQARRQAENGPDGQSCFLSGGADFRQLYRADHAVYSDERNPAVFTRLCLWLRIAERFPDWNAVAAGSGIYGVGFIVINTLSPLLEHMLLAFPIAVLTAAVHRQDRAQAG